MTKNSIVFERQTREREGGQHAVTVLGLHSPTHEIFLGAEQSKGSNSDNCSLALQATTCL